MESGRVLVDLAACGRWFWGTWRPLFSRYTSWSNSERVRAPLSYNRKCRVQPELDTFPVVQRH